MIQVNFTTFKFDRDTKEWVEPATAVRVTRADGAERWARLQPFAYRSGDLNVEVTEVASAEPAGAAFHYSTAA